MGGYLLRRLALILPTLLGILLINFAIVQAAPGGPVDQAIARLQGVDGGGPLGLSLIHISEPTRHAQ
ncbi:peptide ABC transporter permease, partial [Pseudomonas aeruginosa]|nr:peptide ABC transporter permease [Pseudomonas aeruginosa]